jgi:hypothetical protein
LAEAEVGGRSFAPGHFVEYFVVTGRPGDWRAARLLQRGSVTYSATEEGQDYVDASRVRDPASHALGDPPRWAHRSEALWPTVLDRPMVFVGQIQLPQMPVTESKLTWDVTLYLFWARSETGEDIFKLVDQRPSQQSAEEHYADEE